MNLQREFIAIAGYSTVFLLIFGVAETWRIVGSPYTEKTRKLVHFASGAVCLSFIYLLQSHWSVLILCILFVALMYLTKKYGLLKSVHDVERKSSGGFYYPAAVYGTFFIAGVFNQPHFYLIAILVLAISDSLAALVGGRYGFKMYRTEDSYKSLEGSVIFFLVTFIVVHTCLLLLTPIGRAESLLAAVYLSILVTAFESISLGGADNLFIPLGTISILIRIVDQPLSIMVNRITILFVLYWFIYLTAKHTRAIGLSAVITIALLGFGAYALAGLEWVFPVLIATSLLSRVDIFLEPSTTSDPQYNIRPTFYVIIVSFIWILAGLLISDYRHVLFVSFTANLTCSLSIFWKRRSKLTHIPYRLSLPPWLRHARMPLRNILLTLILASPSLFISSSLSPLFTLAMILSVNFAIEITYWQLEQRKRGSWPNIRFLQATTLISIFWTTLAALVSMWYYDFGPLTSFWRISCTL